MEPEKVAASLERMTINTIIECQTRAWEVYVANRTEENLMEWRKWGLALLDTLVEQQRRVFLSKSK